MVSLLNDVDSKLFSKSVVSLDEFKIKVPSDDPQYQRAMKVVKPLSDQGHQVHIAGGWIRDLLVGKVSDDIDLITDASVQKILSLFQKTYNDGIDYGVVIVEEEGEKFEVATFRKDGEYCNGRTPFGIHQATLKEDAKRRDLTVNGLTFDPIAKVVHDYVGGLQDLLVTKQLRTIKDADESFNEDRLRVLRTIRFSVKLGLDIEPKTEEAARKYAPDLFPSLTKFKVIKELKKMSKYPNFAEGILKLHDFGSLQAIFPKLANVTREELEARVKAFDKFPMDAPLILYLRHLFPKAKNKEMMKLCNELLLSKKEGRDALQSYDRIKSEVEEGNKKSPYQWAKLYTDENAMMDLKVIAASLDDKQRVQFVNEHESRMTQLSPHIKRMRTRKKFLSANRLKELGATRGRDLGKMLKDAEEIAVNQNLKTFEEVIQALKKTELGKKYLVN